MLQFVPCTWTFKMVLCMSICVFICVYNYYAIFRTVNFSVLYNIFVCLPEQVHLTEKEKQKLQVWSQIMPYRESFAWAIVSLFDNSIGAASVGSASPSSPLAPSMSGSTTHDGVFEPSAKVTLDGKLGYSSRSSVLVEISNLNKVKESYTEDSLQACTF